MEFSHVPVLLNECLDNLNIKPDGLYVDGTLGGAGHASCILRRLGTGGRLVGIDRDSDALATAGARLKTVKEEEKLDGSYETVKSNFGSIPEVLRELQAGKADGILLDLGVSSYQLDNAERGFSYMADAPLDMRMDRDAALTAEMIVNDYSEEELKRILFDYGEERFAPLIVRRIAAERRTHRIGTTGELVRIIEQSIPGKYQKTGGHPAKKTFQAIRIECNGELKVLEDDLDRILDALAPGGRLAVITFHSLEDRLVKNIMRTAESPCVCPKNFPVCVCGRVSKGRVITRKPILPSEEEMQRNSRSKSAKLRVFEHI